MGVTLSQTPSRNAPEVGGVMPFSSTKTLESKREFVFRNSYKAVNDT